MTDQIIYFDLLGTTADVVGDGIVHLSAVVKPATLPSAVALSSCLPKVRDKALGR